MDKKEFEKRANGIKAGYILKLRYTQFLKVSNMYELMQDINNNNGTDGIIDSMILNSDTSDFFEDNRDIISQFLKYIYQSDKNIVNNINKSIIENYKKQDLKNVLNYIFIDNIDDENDIKNIFVWFTLEVLSKFIIKQNNEVDFTENY